MTPANSKLLFVKSKCNNDVDSGRNSARAMAPAELRDVPVRKRRFREVLRVNAVRRDWICRKDGQEWEEGGERRAYAIQQWSGACILREVQGFQSKVVFLNAIQSGIKLSLI